MDTKLVYQASNEINANIIKGVLENAGVKTMSMAIGNLRGTASVNVSHGIYVMEDKEGEARKILEEYERGEMRV